MSLQVITHLFCDVCGIYPEDAFWEERKQGGSNYRTWLKIAESGRPVLPEGWLYKQGELGDTTTVFCSLVCAGREIEALELRARKADIWQSRAELTCTHCQNYVYRQSGRYYVLPPGWGHPDHYLLCGTCMETQSIREKYKKLNEAYDPL